MRKVIAELVLNIFFGFEKTAENTVIHNFLFANG